MNGNELYDLKYITLRKYLDKVMLERGYYYYSGRGASAFCLPYLTLKEIDRARENTYDGTDNKGAFYFWVGDEEEIIGNNNIKFIYYPTTDTEVSTTIIKDIEFFKTKTFIELLDEFIGALNSLKNKAKYKIHMHNIETILTLDKLS